jgi:SAM-dependent methyltransferase
VGPDDVFIDLGCGKGRVLLQAARLPFKRVVGVELSLELADVARANVQSCARRLECPDLEIVAHDVTTYDVPDDVTVVYMYNAFRGHILQGALDRLVESHRRNPRRMRLIYRTPQEHDRVVASGFVPTRIARGLRPSREWSRKMAIRVYELS